MAEAKTPKRAVSIKRTVDTAARTVTFKAVDNLTTSVIQTLTFNYGRVESPALQAYAAGHGWNQRIGDAIAQSAGTSWAAKFTDAQALVDYYYGLPADAAEAAWDRPKSGKAPPRELTREEKQALFEKLARELGVTVGEPTPQE